MENQVTISKGTEVECSRNGFRERFKLHEDITVCPYESYTCEKYLYFGFKFPLSKGLTLCHIKQEDK